MFEDAAGDYISNQAQGQITRTIVGGPFGTSTYSNAFLGETANEFWGRTFGILELDGSCGEGKSLRALTILDSEGSPVTTKSFVIPQQFDLLYDENLYTSSDNKYFYEIDPTGVTIGVTGGIANFNAALWGLTTIAATNSNPRTITYNLGGGSGTIPSQPDVDEGQSFNIAASTGLTRSGYTFNRWNDGATNYSPGDSYTVATSNVTLTATWTVNAIPVVVYVPVPIPYLNTIDAPKMRLSSGRLLCSAGTYKSGFRLDGVVQGSSSALFTPSAYTFNLIINGIVQTSQSVTSGTNSAQWDLTLAPSGSTATCSVTVTANSLTNTDRSTENTNGLGAASSALALAITQANEAYAAIQGENSRIYQKALVDNRAAWRADVARIRVEYYSELKRINALPASKVHSSLKSAALKTYISAQKQSTAAYKNTQPAAANARDAANKAALDSKNEKIIKANSTYGSFIESIGYGILTP
jgi:uncharacterized repeat protein (TIGR02543 family)